MQKLYNLLTTFLVPGVPFLVILVFLVPGKAQSCSFIDKILVTLVNKLYTICIHVVSTNPVQRAL